MKLTFRLICAVVVAITAFLSVAPLQAQAYIVIARWTINAAYYRMLPIPTMYTWGILDAALTWSAPANFYFIPDDSSVYWWNTNYLGPGVWLAATGVQWSNGYITDCNTDFNTYHPFSYGGGGGTYDTRTVALHEFGHWVSLADLYWWDTSDTSIVMYYGYTGIKTSLNMDDINGIRAIYGVLRRSGI